MTVAQYIEALQRLPQDLPCLLRNDEYSFYVTSNGPEVRTIGIRHNNYTEIWEDHYVFDERQTEQFNAVIL